MSKFWSNTTKRVEPYIPGEQLNQTNLIKLNTNENPYPPAPAVIEAIQTEAASALNRYPSPTVDELKADIAAYYKLASDNVFIGNGSDEVLAFSFLAFFKEGKSIRFPAISYSFYPVYAKLFNIPYDNIRLREDFTIDPKDYFHSEGGVIFPNPNAPTSIFLELGNVKKILENNPNQVVIVDEAYVDFANASAVSLLPDYPNLLVIQTLSKSRSLAGLRVGFALGSKELIEGLTRIKDSFNSYTLDRLAIVGARAAIKNHAYFTQTTRKIMTTREWLISELQARGFHVQPSQTNFLFIRHKEQSAEKLYKQLKENNILIRYFRQPPIEQFLRVTIGTDSDMERFLEVLDQLI